MATATIPTENVCHEWGTARLACATLGTNYKCLRRLVDQGKITVRDLGGCKARYSLEDCERLLKTSVRPAHAGAIS